MAEASGSRRRVFAAPDGEAPCSPAPPPRVVVLADQAPDWGAQLREILLAAGGYEVSLERSAAATADLIIPLLTPGQDSRKVLTELRGEALAAPLLPVFYNKHLAGALDQPLPGVTDFLVGPVREPEMLARVRRLLPLDVEEDTQRVRESLEKSVGLDRLRGVDPAFVAVKQQILRVAKTEVSVLITGETGTGKELIAQAIHYLNGRADKPFVPVNCGAIPADLFENELFGHHRGAFTDARSYQRGVVAEADGGTLFLDEINALTLPAQVKLLRFLEDRSYRPLGSPRAVKADVRMVAATNTDLRRMALEGAFREDLFYRLHVVSLHLPPLRERVGDIELLAEYFLERHATTHGSWRFSAKALQALRDYEWPGNVRELENVVQQVVVMNPPKLILDVDLPWPIRPVEADPGDSSFRTAKAHAIARFERSYLTSLLQVHGGNITRSAQAAGQDRHTFRRLVQKHRLDPSVWARPGATVRSTRSTPVSLTPA
ncbi:MAG: sigma-54 interaction domain-containing protein [Candidatus Methylomirabilia bacterium]